MGNKQQNKVYGWKCQLSKNENTDRERLVIYKNSKREKKGEKKKLESHLTDPADFAL